MNKENITQLFNLHGLEPAHGILVQFNEAHYTAQARFQQWGYDRNQARREYKEHVKANLRSSNTKCHSHVPSFYTRKRARRLLKTQTDLTQVCKEYAVKQDMKSLAALTYHCNITRTYPQEFQPAISRFKHEVGKHSFDQLPSKWRDTFTRSFLNQYLPHKSQENPSRVAYVQSLAKFMRRDPETLHYKEPLYTVTSPTKFIMMINETHSLGYDENECRKLGEAWVASCSPLTLRILSNNDSKWADNRHGLQHEWVRLYEQIEVDFSCMRSNPNNAVACYGLPNNNLGLAYWEDGEGNLMSRSVVNTDTMTFSRVYPSKQSNSDKGLTTVDGERLLEAAGYGNDSSETMHKVMLNYDEDGDGRIICPYIDGGSPTVSQYYDSSRRMHLLQVDMRGNGNHGAQNTSTYGLVEGMDGTRCECCGDHFDSENEGAYVDNYGDVCETCLNNDFAYAYTSSRRASSGQEYIRQNDAVEYDGDWYLDDSEVLAVNDLCRCSQCEEVHHIDDLHDVEGEGLTCEDCCVPLSSEFYDDADYRHALPEDTTETEAGETILNDDVVTIDGDVYHKDEEVTKTAEEWEALLKEAKGSSLGMTYADVTATASQIAEMLN